MKCLRNSGEVTAQSSKSLEEEKVLLFDCQATGRGPDRGFVLELAWCWFRGRQEVERCRPTSFLVQPPETESIPPRVLRLTGLEPAQLAEGCRAAEAWDALQQEVAQATGPVPMVIHFAAFERGFLESLKEEDDVWQKLHIVCTHAISRRVLPSLPRKGLRAVAGYLGWSTPSQRRAVDHVRATAHIWKHLIPLMESQAITSWSELLMWLDQPVAATPVDRRYPWIPDFSEIPARPGVYRMRRTNGDLLYVGKATSLRSRIRTYFQPATRHPHHILEMLSQAAEVSTREMATGLEASMLETDLIKQLRPPYNVALRSGRQVVPEICLGSGRRPLRGPFGSRRQAAEIRSCLEFLECPGPDSLRALLPPARSLTDQVLSDGLDRFKRDHAPLSRSETALLQLKQIDHRLRRLEDQEGGVESDGGEDWNAAAVSSFLVKLIRRSARGLRRARWIRCLGYAAVRWREDGQAGWRTLLFRGGEIVFRGNQRSDEPPPLLPRPPVAAGIDFDLSTFDRLSVLTAELKRLVSGGKPAEVWPLPGKRWDSEDLGKLLQLV